MASGSDNLLTIHTTNTTERVRVNSDGDVIVGSGITVSPDGDIFATGVTTSTTFVGALTGNVTGNISGGTVAGSTGTFTGDVDIADKIVHTGDTNTAIRFPAADTFTVETGGSERLRVSSNGKVRVGSGDASYNLDVKGSGQQVILVGSTDAGGAFITLDGDSNGDGSGTDYCYIGHNTDGDLQIGADNPSGNANIIFYAGNNDEKARILSSGGLTFNGASAAANALDDYEEGTFTPRLGPHNSMNTIHENGLGRYTKIGNKVHCTMHWINKDGTAFPTNAVIRIDSLPYTIKHVGNNTSAHYVAMSQMMYNIQFGQQHKHYFFSSHNSNYITGLKSRDGTTWEDWSTSDWNQSSIYFMTAITYMTT